MCDAVHVFGQPRLHPLPSLSVQSCGIESEVVGAVTAALHALPGLREVELGLRRPPLPSTIGGRGCGRGGVACWHAGWGPETPPHPSSLVHCSCARLRLRQLHSADLPGCGPACTHPWCSCCGGLAPAHCTHRAAPPARQQRSGVGWRGPGRRGGRCHGAASRDAHKQHGHRWGAAMRAALPWPALHAEMRATDAPQP